MDREYLTEYQQRENIEYNRQVIRLIREGKFSPKENKYPSDERFVKLKKERSRSNSTLSVQIF
jgi:hypothetical protein